MADGSIIISTGLDTSSFYDSLALLEGALNSFASRFTHAMVNSSSIMKSSVISAANAAASTVENRDWEASGSRIMSGIAAGIAKSGYLVNDMMRAVLSDCAAHALDQYASQVAAAASNYTQNIYLKDSESSPYQVARQIRRQSEDMIRV